MVGLNNERTTLADGIHHIHSPTLVGPNHPRGGANTPHARAWGRGAPRRFTLCGGPIRDFPRCLHFVGQPPGRVKLKDEEERVEIATSWSGFYVGGGLGANWTNGSWTTRDVRTFETSDIVVDAIKDLKAENLAEDVYFGYLWQGAPEWLAGLEAEFVYFNAYMDPGIPGTGGLPGDKASDSVSVRAKWSASLRARLGYLVTPGTQLYVAGGPSWLNMNATINCTGPGVCGTNGIAPFSQTNSTTKLGWTVGGGIETMLWDNWRGHIEYRHGDYGTFSTNFGTPAQLALAADIKVHTDAVMAGLTYGFGSR